MCPTLLAFGTAGFTFLRYSGRFAETIGKCKGCHAGIQGVVKGGCSIRDIGYGTAWAKGMQNIPHT